MTQLSTTSVEGRRALATRSGRSLPYQPTSSEIDQLIDRAKEHALGVDYLLNGELGSVAATFGAHAFAVCDARNRLHDG